MLKQDLRRRVAIEPELGHMKSDGLLGWNFLKGAVISESPAVAWWV